jgi:hypothetical protein
MDGMRIWAPNFAPTAYLGDAAEAFANASMRVFPSITERLMCEIHVMKVRET